MRIGFITIGQSPRVDVFRDIGPLLPRNIEIVERGALDGYTKDEVLEKLRPGEGEVVYVTRLRDGTEVMISKNIAIELVRTKIEELANEGVDLIVILCSGEFPEYRVGIPIIYPDKLLKSIVSSLNITGTLGVLAPSEKQIQYMRRRWSEIHQDLEIRAISPYTSSLEEFTRIGKELAAKNIRYIVMDCIGYTLKQKEALRSGLGQNSLILNTRSIVARVISELVS